MYRSFRGTNPHSHRGASQGILTMRTLCEVCGWTVPYLQTHAHSYRDLLACSREQYSLFLWQPFQRIGPTVWQYLHGGHIDVLPAKFGASLIILTLDLKMQNFTGLIVNMLNPLGRYLEMDVSEGRLNNSRDSKVYGRLGFGKKKGILLL